VSYKHESLYLKLGSLCRSVSVVVEYLRKMYS
jgi:hypothetical protein